MTVRIREKELAISALRMVYRHPSGEILTSELVLALTEWFEPEGEDAEILEGRHDTKFSQKVRNLVSHREGKHTMFTLGYADYTGDGIKITELGRNFVRSLPDHE
jgi:hypothetical protein